MSEEGERDQAEGESEEWSCGTFVDLGADALREALRVGVSGRRWIEEEQRRGTTSGGRRLAAAYLGTTGSVGGKEAGLWCYAGVAAVTGLPDLVAEHDDGLGAGAIVLRSEVAAEDGGLSEQ